MTDENICPGRHATAVAVSLLRNSIQTHKISARRRSTGEQPKARQEISWVMIAS